MLESIWRSSLVLFSLAIIACSAFFGVMSTAKTDLVKGSISSIYEVDNVFSGTLTQVIKIENLGPYAVKDGKLDVPIIKNETAHHYVVIFNVTSTVGNPRLLNDDSEITYALWDNMTIVPGETLTARIEYYVLSFDTRVLIDLTKIASYDKYTDLYKTFTQPEKLVESDAPEIISKSQSLTQDASNIHDKVARIYDFVVSYLHYEPQEDERGALWALVNGTGDCSEYSYLFVALCRAVGIPARVNVGFGFQGSQSSVVDGHMWAEYYLQGYGWVPVDPTWNVFDAIDEKHFATMRGASEDIPYANYFFNFSSGPDSAEVTDSQVVTLLDSPNSFRGDELAEETLAAVKTVNEGRSAVATSRFLGGPVFFGSEAARVDHDLAASELSLQEALENWQIQPQTARAQILEAQSRGEEALRGAWMLVSYVFAMFIGALMAIIMVAYLLFRRRSNKAEYNLGDQGSSRVALLLGHCS